MLRRTLLLLVPSALFASRGSDLYSQWHSNMTEWLTSVNSRTTGQTYPANEPNLWKLTKQSWREFEQYVDKYYKGTPNE